MNTIEIHGYTHTGHVKRQNEDSIYFSAENGIAIVADGMGGHARGDVASRVAVDKIVQSIEDGTSLEEAVDLAHTEIIRAAEGDTTKKGMATTVVVVAVEGRKYKVCWVGDSRAYLIRGNEITQLTVDHSYHQYMRDQGVPEEKLKSLGKKNAVLRALGLPNHISEAVTGIVKNGDLFLVCSDGLTAELSDKSIWEGVKSGDPIDASIKKLMSDALESGGKDNISVVAAAITRSGSMAMLGNILSSFGTLFGENEFIKERVFPIAIGSLFAILVGLLILQFI